MPLTSALLLRVLLFGLTSTSLKSNLISESTRGISPDPLYLINAQHTWIDIVIKMAMEGDVLARDHPTLIHYLNEINEKLGQVKDHVKLLYQHVQSSKLQSKASEIDLLELKNQLLLRYGGVM